MKLKKNNINALCEIEWWDAHSSYGVLLNDFVRGGLCLNTTIGWLRYYDKRFIVLSSETSNKYGGEDLTMIPYGWIKSIRFVHEKKEKA